MHENLFQYCPEFSNHAFWFLAQILMSMRNRLEISILKISQSMTAKRISIKRNLFKVRKINVG